MKNNIIFWVLTLIFFVIYFKIEGWIWSRWVPFNTATDLIALFIIIFINLPLSAISAQKTIRIIKSSDGSV